VKRLALRALWGFALLAMTAGAATLTVGPVGFDVFFFEPFAPALELHPADPQRGFIADSETLPGVVELRLVPGQPLGYGSVGYELPAGLDCSESAPFGTPRLGGFSLEPLPGPNRGWITTTLCELAVPFDYASGADVPVAYAGRTRLGVPTRHTLTGSFTRYQAGGGGAAVSSFRTNFTSAALRVGQRLVVATSNLQQAGASPVFNPGTVLFFELDDAHSPPQLTPAAPFFALTSDPNPIALTALPGGRVLVTNAGIHDASFPPVLTGQGSIDVIDPAVGRLVASIPLGAVNPGGRSLALDPTASVALAGSQTLRALFAIDVRGLGELPLAPIDPAVQRPSCNDGSAASAGGLPCLRSRVIRGEANPIALPPPPGASGPWSLVSQVRFAASGAFAAATSFNDGGLALVAFDARNLARPHPLLASRFGGAQTLAATAAAGSIGQECCPGPLVLQASGAGTLGETRVLFATATPNGVVVRGQLAGSLPLPTGDFDADGVEDALDDCPVTADVSQQDSGGVGAAPADGIGDACQCGDASDDGRVDGADVAAVRRRLAGSPAPLAAPQKCDVGGSSACDLSDAVRLVRALAALPPGLAHTCAPFLP
jgi:hypothetical protein